MSRAIEEDVMRLLGLAVAMVALAACGFNGYGGNDKIDMEAVSEDKGVTATVIRSEGGATVSSVFRVYVQGAHAGKKSEVFRADRVQGLRILWSGEKLLMIHMVCGRVFAYRNFYDSAQDGRLVRRVEVKLETQGLCVE